MAKLDVQRMCKDIAATAERLKAVPALVRTEVAVKLTARMANVSILKGRRRSGTATPTADGVLVRVYSDKPHKGPGWALLIQSVAKAIFIKQANGR